MRVGVWSSEMGLQAAQSPTWQIPAGARGRLGSSPGPKWPDHSRGFGGNASPLMMDFMSHFEESMLCNAMRSSPGFRGDKAEFPSPAAGGSSGEVEETVWRPKRQVQVPQIGGSGQ